ncbi:T9SS type A sorting domain-containing protein [Flavobacterium dankookense]|uniref:Putative secreted protein (Por secretion system target) n=1 Tax=Flavobacterium dankookense TaxID=706186 RepID=A0A4R6QIP8_9FLAO|nr:T9SS type A sorting domain-containing protein [Flavobacterium dankookense]TDP61969.1 putative secreted protein (Por secretion system target) [Flavobacterium dankookense]
MKKILFYTALLWANIALAQYREWHVKPYPSQIENETSTAGDGTSFETAWALQHALNNPGGVIQPGDTVWLHGGVYKGRYLSNSNLSGTETDYIRIASYPGEWAILNGNVNNNRLPPSPPYNQENDPNYIPPTIEEELSTYSVSAENSSTYNNTVLYVESGYIHYDNFEITFLGDFDRLLVAHSANPPLCSNSFKQVVGINHFAETVNKYSNLVIRNLPGSGIGSWKASADTEIYGCLIYNNGYIQRLYENCNGSPKIEGKGLGIYAQNIDLFKRRRLENNILINNYDSGIGIWSSAENPGATVDYLKNFDVYDNVLINNGGPQRDDTANMLVFSYDTTNVNHPHDVEIKRNVFYINSYHSHVSGIYVGNSTGVTIKNNNIFKGTAGIAALLSNTNLTFRENFYFGKRLQTFINPTDYLNKNWDFDYNKYYTDFHAENMYNIISPIPNVTPGLRYKLPQFKSIYNDELNSTRLGCWNIEVIPEILYTLAATESTQKNFVKQNKYNPNVFYVTIFNPRSDLNSTINVDFSSYGYSIPNNKYYKIKDAENYFGTEITGTIQNNVISFPMTLTAIEAPTGTLNIDFTHPVHHSLPDLSVFVVEFTCPNLEYDKQIQSQTDTTSKSYLIKNNITLGTNYIADVNADVIANASKQIKVISNAHFKAGSKVHLKIQDPCPDIEYVNQGAQSRMANSNQETETKKTEEELVLIYPNPNSGVFIVESQSEQKIKNIKISDINTAKIIFEQNYEPKKAIDINISSERDGLYIVQATFEDNSTVIKTIIKK